MNNEQKKIMHAMYEKAFRIARSMLSTGGTPPCWRAVDKAARRLLAGKKIEGSWRSWPSKEKSNVA